MPKSIFLRRCAGIEHESVTDTRATTDKHDPFDCGVQTWEKVGGQKMGQNAIWGSGE